MPQKQRPFATFFFPNLYFLPTPREKCRLAEQRRLFLPQQRKRRECLTTAEATFRQTSIWNQGSHIFLRLGFQEGEAKCFLQVDALS